MFLAINDNAHYIIQQHSLYASFLSISSGMLGFKLHQSRTGQDLMNATPFLFALHALYEEVVHEAWNCSKLPSHFVFVI